MPLQVTECQTTKTWYALYGEVEASELFPTLLANSKSVKEVVDEIQTEPEEDDGRYNGYPADDGEMEEEISEFTESAIAEFHDEALSAAKNALTTIQPGQTLLRESYEGLEQEFLEEAARLLGIAVPWDPAEAAQIDAEEARHQRLREEEEERVRQTPEVLERARNLFSSGSSHATVRAMFPNYGHEIAKLVGELRSQGMRIAK